MQMRFEPCSLGVGCDEAGVCYADAHNQPEQCPFYQPPEKVAARRAALDEMVRLDQELGLLD